MPSTDLLPSPSAPGGAPRFPLDAVMLLTRAESLGQLADRLGVKPDTVRQWARRGLSSRQADEVAIRLGYVPQNIWPNYCDDVDIEVDLDLDPTVDLAVAPDSLLVRQRLTTPSEGADGPRRDLEWDLMGELMGFVPVEELGRVRRLLRSVNRHRQARRRPG